MSVRCLVALGSLLVGLAGPKLYAVQKLSVLCRNKDKGQ